MAAGTNTDAPDKDKKPPRRAISGSHQPADSPGRDRSTVLRQLANTPRQHTPPPQLAGVSGPLREQRLVSVDEQQRDVVMGRVPDVPGQFSADLADQAVRPVRPTDEVAVGETAS
jgi:hypothetical protein